MTKIRKISKNPLLVNFKFSEQDFLSYREAFLKSNFGNFYQNIEYQYFCDIEILPESRISNYKILGEI